MPVLIDKQDYLRRLEVAKVLTNTSNCIGTALFLLGLKNKDSHVDPSRALKLFQKWFDFLEQTTIQALLFTISSDSNSIQGGYLLGLNGSFKVEGTFPELLHCMIVSPIDNTKIVHRTGYHENAEERVLVDLLNEYPALLNVFIYTLR